MESYEKVILDILKSSLNNQKYENLNSNIEWDKVINEAREHDISSLIYFTLSNKTKEKIDKDKIENWKREVFLMTITQNMYIKQFCEVLNKYKEEKIECIALKGLVLRNLYPSKELRSMGDCDILVKKEDYQKAKEILLSLGYISDNHDNDIHEGFIKKGNFEIELHNKLVNSKFIKTNFDNFENDIFKNSISIKVEDCLCRTLSKEDFFIHLSLHMAVHTKLTGLGLRQLYDIAVYVKENMDIIDWQKLKNELMKYKLLEYTKGILILINDLFNINAIERICNINEVKFKKSDKKILLENILRAGVHGKKNLNQSFECIYNNNNPVRNTVRLFFPKKIEMQENYKGSELENESIIKLYYERIRNDYIKKYGFIKIIKEINYSLSVARMRRIIIKKFEIPK